MIEYNKFVWMMYEVYGLTTEEMIKVWDENKMVVEDFSIKVKD